jgi:tetratricopeptide (TPR) repeat protein
MGRDGRSAFLLRHLFPLCALTVGCATTPLENLPWHATRSQHYEILSALGEEETTNLAISLERTRATLEFLWGEPVPPAPVPTRVLAFDDRGIGRPFAHGGDRSYLLPRAEGDLIVLRTGGGWDGDAREPLKRSLARRVLARATEREDLPWLPEGVAQLASTLQVRGAGAWLGDLPRGAHSNLLDAQWVSFDRILSATDLHEWPNRDRDLFELETWALCHYLWTSEARRRDTPERVAAYRRAVRAGTPPGEAANATLGENLQRDVWQHLTMNQRVPTLMLRIRLEGSRPQVMLASKPEVLVELAELALAVDAPRRARRHIDQAAEIDPTGPRVLAGLGRVAEREGDVAEADRRFGDALLAAPEQAWLQAAWADVLRERAARIDSDARGDLLARARSHYERAIALAPALPAAYAGLAESFLLAGEDPRLGLPPLRQAQALLPGDARLEVLGARLSLAAGDIGAARSAAARLMTSAHSPEAVAEARSLEEEIEEAP